MQKLLDLRKLKSISDYQFSPEITDILFIESQNLKIIRSKNTDKIRYIYFEEEIFLTLKPTNGLFTLSFLAAKKILKHTSSPRLRVVVLTEVSSFIKKGRNVFCKHVVDADENLRPMDEVIVVNQEDELLAIGRINIAIPYIRTFERGVAVNVRKGIDKYKRLKNKNSNLL
jgi:predicted RNA-binding protein (TIGR00451 family)